MDSMDTSLPYLLPVMCTMHKTIVIEQWYGTLELLIQYPLGISAFGFHLFFPSENSKLK